MHISTLCWFVPEAIFITICAYCAFLGILTIPFCQRQIIYLNKLTFSWFKNFDGPEKYGFLHNQVTPFFITTFDGEVLHIWHILPLKCYRDHEDELCGEFPGNLPPSTHSRVAFRLLSTDPKTLMVIYLHGAAGTLGSGYRPASYRALSAAAPAHIHIIAVEYRGFGQSSGTPSERGLSNDAITVIEWVMKVAKIPASRIVLFGQSLGTAVAISAAHEFALRSPSVYFAGMVLVAPFANVETLTATYKIAGLFPILSPVACLPKLLKFLNTFVKDTWLSSKKIAELVRLYRQPENISTRYQITLIHAQDDDYIPCAHAEQLFKCAVSASDIIEGNREAIDEGKTTREWSMSSTVFPRGQQTPECEIRLVITKYGKHDAIMSYPVVSLAVLRAFDAGSN